MSKRRATTASLAVMALALGAGGGCTQDFPPFNRLDSLRVLAIQAEPAAPLPGETTTLTPLVFAPKGDSSVTYQWSWCPLPKPAEMGHECAITQEALALILSQQLMMQVDVPSFDLGANPTAMLQNGLPPEVLGAVCAGAIPNIPAPNCSGGFPVQVGLTIDDGTEQVQAVVTVRMRFDADTQAPNANPTIDGLTATPPGADEQPLPPVDMLTPETITLPRKAPSRINVLVVPEASETYVGLDDTRMPGTQHERLFITWYIESGDTDDPRTSFIPDRTEFEKMLKNTWNPQESRLYTRNDARIYVVLHDNRGGVGWRTGIVNLDSTP